MHRAGASTDRPDGLGRRIGLTFAALALVYTGLVAALVLAGISGLLVGAGAVVFAAVHVAASDRLLLNAISAHEADAAQQPTLFAAVERLCVQADLPRPRVMICDSGMPNALAVQRPGGRATICVDRRALALLEPSELEAVIAHELAHVAHRDVLVMTVASFMSIVAALLTRLAIYGGHAVIRSVAIVVAPVAWGASLLLLRALSRYRELAADRTAAALTGRPSALAAALLKLDEAVTAIPRKDLRAAHSAAALAIVPLPAGRFAARLTATHPSTAQRVEALRLIGAQDARRVGRDSAR